MINKSLYVACIFLSAFLLFQLQPIIAKFLLPWFGGAASVWIVCMLFFQFILLGGYFYSHWVVHHVEKKRQYGVHLLLLLGSLFVLPIMPHHVTNESAYHPIVNILFVLLTSVGLPYFMLSTTSPLLQSWYANSHQNGLPYRLFALSNLSSLMGLLAYPFMIEPYLTLTEQSKSWSIAYVCFVLFCAMTTILQMKVANKKDSKPVDRPENNGSLRPSVRDKILWMSLAACASTLLLATTNYLIQDVASIPFLWILPLSLYLLTFTLCFDRNGWYRKNWYLVIMAVVIIGSCYALLKWGASYNIAIKILFFSLSLFACCMFCHGELVTRKPMAQSLTSFYLMIALGGALGGILVGILAPTMLSGPFELPLALSFCALLLFLVNYDKHWVITLGCGALCISMMIVSGIYIKYYIEGSLFHQRNFYGTLKISAHDKNSPDAYRVLVNGTIVHGGQFQDPKRQQKPTSYYSENSGVGLAMRQLAEGSRRVGVIGLGTGTLLAYARQGDYFHYYEINPLVPDIANRYFTYLSNCLGEVNISIGDGRLLLKNEEPQQYDLLVVDAFSGDSIPIHLMTTEAIELYFKHLKPDGILALHVSNLHLNLIKIVAKLSETLQKKAILIEMEGDPMKQISASDWVLLTSNRDLMKSPDIKKVAYRLKGEDHVKAWTDDYSNLIQIMKY